MANTSNKAPRITKTMKFEAIKALLDGKTPAIDLTIAAAKSFLDDEIALLAKKNKSDPNKMTATQRENEGLKEKIMEVIHGLSPEVIGLTCSDIMKQVDGIASTQKVVPLVRQLRLADRLDCTEVKGRTYWHLPKNDGITIELDELDDEDIA